MLLTPFENRETVFCRWNCEGESIDEMLPDLKNIISFNTNWRAVIVTENNKNKINPFDYVGYSDYIGKSAKTDFNENYIKCCKDMFRCFEKSLENPLTKLSSALCEAPFFAEKIDADIDEITQNSEKLLQYIFRKSLNAVNTRRLAVELRKYRSEQLSVFVDEAAVENFLTAVTEKDYSVIFEMLSGKKLISFLEFAKIGSCTTYDPGYWFALLENTKKAQLFEKLKEDYCISIPIPDEVLCVGLRTCDTQLHDTRNIWREKNEADYAEFVRYNLYNENIRFLLYDMEGEESNNIAAEVLKFQVLLQIVAMHGNSAFSITKNKVYIVDMEYDKRELNRTIAKLIARQKVTAAQINEEIYLLKSKKEPELDNRTARMIFESDVRIPVETGKEFIPGNMKADCKIGLSRDCPEDELLKWEDRYYEIKKLFKRFLREPRRAVKKACTVDFKEKNLVSDMRAIGLNENQKEDIAIKLEEEEHSMVNTVTSPIYDTSRFTEEMENASKEIKRGIAQRMTRKKTMTCGLIAMLAYFIGFLPLIFSNINTMKSFLFSFLVAGVVVAIFAVCGFVHLFNLRREQADRIRHFNKVMDGICSEIKASLATFSEYLSHACMVMRERSVLRLAETKETEDVTKIRRLRYNRAKLEKEIDKNYQLLKTFSDEQVESLLTEDEKKNIVPYNYDYAVQGKYEYAFFENYTFKEIDYMQKGFKVEVPMPCVEEIILKREELYD